LFLGDIVVALARRRSEERRGLDYLDRLVHVVGLALQVEIEASNDPDLDTHVAEYFEVCYCPTMDGTHTQ
jgi:hypothetical protein